MKAIISILNWLTDMDWGWWPLLSLRPSKEKDITNVVVAKITPFFGTVTGILFAIIAQHMQSLQILLVDIGAGWLIFFVLFRVTFAPAWNSRAKMLREGNTEQITPAER